MPCEDTKYNAMLALIQMFENSRTYFSLLFLYSVAETSLATQLSVTT